MTPAFEAGAADAMTKMAEGRDWKLRALRTAFRPEVYGGFSGAVMGSLVGPPEDRGRYIVPGAIGGALLAHAGKRGKGAAKKFYESVSGPGTPAAVNAVHGVF